MLLLHTLGKLDNWHCSQKPLLPSGTRRENTSGKHSTGTQGGWGSPPPTPCSTHHKTSDSCQIPSAPPGGHAPPAESSSITPQPQQGTRAQLAAFLPYTGCTRTWGKRTTEGRSAAGSPEFLQGRAALLGPLSPAVNTTQRVANAAWGHEDNPHLAPALPLWREQLLKPPLRGCCCSGTHKPRP